VIQLRTLKRLAGIGIVALFMLLLNFCVAHAWTTTYCVGPQSDATSYQLQTSIDLGITWATQATVPVPSPAPPGCPAGFFGTVFTGASTAMVLVRWLACNLNGCTPRAMDGHFHNDMFRIPLPPGAPQNLVVI